MTTATSNESTFAIPMPIGGLPGFRRWAQSDEFPENGRIDYLAGTIEVDMSPEDLFTHGNLKAEIVAVLHHLIKQRQLGWLFTDSARVSCAAADLSAEPDVMFTSRESIATGRVRLVPKSSHEPDRFIEVEGAPDLIVEIASDSSVTKDKTRLPALYYAAGVLEYWLVDARGRELSFTLFRRGPTAFEPEIAAGDGFLRSQVLSRRFRLDRANDDLGHWSYDLLVRD